MTYEEAKKRIHDWLCLSNNDSQCYFYGNSDEKLCNSCEIHFAIEALDKQIPKKMVNNTEQEWFECPMCGRILIPYYADEEEYCKCGQAIDWSEEE